MIKLAYFLILLHFCKFPTPKLLKNPFFSNLGVGNLNIKDIKAIPRRNFYFDGLQRSGLKDLEISLRAISRRNLYFDGLQRLSPKN